MISLPKIHASVLDAVENCEAATRPLFDASMPPYAVPEPSSLKFLEELAGFHSGGISHLTRTRTRDFYTLVATKFLALIKTFKIAAQHLRRDGNGEEVYYHIERSHISTTYDAFGVRHSYPVHNLICRISKCRRIIQSEPIPRFQTRFLDDLPVELLRAAVQFVGDDDIVALAGVCSGLRTICNDLRLLHRRVSFRLKYNVHSIHTPYPASHDDLHLEILEHMIGARFHLTRLMKAMTANESCARNIRYMSVDNEWEHLWPQHVPSYLLLPTATDPDVFDPLYNSLIATISALPIEHLRLVSLAISERFLTHIASHPTIRRLTVDRYTCFPAFELPTLGPKANNITYLAIGFHGSYYTHRNQWRMMGAFPALRQLYAYTVDVSDTAIRYPAPTSEVRGVHNLEFLHVQCSCRDIGELATWLSFAAADVGGPGSLRRLKIHARSPIAASDARRLVDVLAVAHPSLHVLVLEGLDVVYPGFVRAISDGLPNLRSLSLVRRANAAQKVNKLCEWNDALFKYAEALRNSQYIRHLEINTIWTVLFAGPRLLDALNRSLRGRCRYPSNLARTERHYERDPDDMPADVTSIAYPFARNCPSLRSFAVRAGICHFSCAMRHRDDGKIAFSDVCSAERHERFTEWNPAPRTTWNYRP